MSEAAPPPDSPSVPPNLGAITGPQIIGSLLNYCLFGVLAVQVYIYRLSFPNDNKGIKWLVYFVLIFETVQTILNGVDVFNWFAAGFGNLPNFANPRLSPFYTPMMGSVMALIVQIFFCYRIWIINRSSWWWCIMIACISLTQAVAGFVGGVGSHIGGDVAKRFDETIAVYIWLIGAATADTIIAATMTLLLLRASPGQQWQTNNVVSRIIRLTVETNGASAGIAIVSLALFFGVKGTTYFVTPTFVLGKIYANTLLVTFNNRAFLQKQLSQGTSSFSTRVASQAPKVVPFSAGLTFSDPGEINIGRVTIRSQSHTFVDSELGDTELGDTGYGPHGLISSGRKAEAL